MAGDDTWLVLDTISDAVERVLRVVKPETLLKWHKRSFKDYWAWKSRKKGRGRPTVDPEVRELVLKMARDNLDLDRRRVVGYGVTKHPTAEWTANIFVEAFPWDTAPKYLLRDRDGIYGPYFQRRIKGMGIKEVLIAPRSPWQNPFMKDDLEYYHEDRTHMSLGKDTPNGRVAQTLPEGDGVIVALRRVGGLHHRYEWREAA